MVLDPQTHSHLLAHHRDYKAFTQAMVDSHAGRFDSVFWGFLTKYAPKDVRCMVDLGTGPGLLLPELAARYADASIIGVDAQPEMLEAASSTIKGHERLRLVAHDLGSERALDLDDASADVVIASVVLHELQVPTRLLDEAARVLRPGGAMFVYDWVRQPLESYCDGVRPNSLDEFTHFSEHCRYTPDDLSWLITSSGFEIAEHIARKNGRFLLLAAIRSS